MIQLILLVVFILVLLGCIKANRLSREHLNEVKACTAKTSFVYRRGPLPTCKSFWQKIGYSYNGIFYVSDLLDNFPFEYSGNNSERAHKTIWVNPSEPSSAVIFKERVIARDKAIIVLSVLVFIACVFGIVYLFML